MLIEFLVKVQVHVIMSLKGLRLWRLGSLQQQFARSTAYRQLSQPAAHESHNNIADPKAPPKAFKDIPGPRGYPFIGTALDYAGKNMSKMHVILRSRYEKYGPIYREKLFPGMPEQVIIFDPDDVETVFRADGEWPNRPEGGEVFKKVRNEAGLDPGILQLQGKEWHDQRMPMSKFMMVPRKVGEYHEGLNAITLDLLKNIEKGRDGGTAVYNDVPSLLFKWAFESVSFFTLGQRLGALDLEGNTPPECQEFIDEVGNFFELTTKIFFSVPTYLIYRNKLWRSSVNSQRAVKDLAMKFISKRLDEIEEEDKQLLQQATDDEAPVKVDFLTYLVHSGKMSLDAITANVIDLMTAGVDTTSYTLMWSLYCLATNPEAQEKLRNEVQQTVGNSEIVTPEHVGRMPYLRNVVRETQRLYPIASFNQRISSRDVVLSGYTVPKGTEILMPVVVMGRMPQLFSNPDQFSPERWSRENKEQMHSFASLPFGTGPRMCVGRRLAELELNIALSQIMKSFRVEFNEEEPVGYVIKFLLLPDRQMNLVFRDLH